MVKTKSSGKKAGQKVVKNEVNAAVQPTVETPVQGRYRDDDPLVIAFAKIIEGAKKRVRKTDIPDPLEMAEAVRSELAQGPAIERRRATDKPGIESVPVEMIGEPEVVEPPTPEVVEDKVPLQFEVPIDSEAINDAKASSTTKSRAPARPELRGNSTVERPTKLVWTIADRMSARKGGATRAQVLAECQKKGITFYTARTQYQLWKAHKEGK